MPAFTVGQEVHVKPEYADSWPARAHVPFATFIVTAVPMGRSTTYRLRHKAITVAIGIKAPEDYLAAGPHPAFEKAEIAPVLESGTVVEFKDGAEPGLWVVTGYAAKGHQVYPLGGASVGRKNVSGLRLEVITLELGE